MAVTFTPDLAINYQLLFNTCVINPAKTAEIDRQIDTMVANKAIYDSISTDTNVPWYFIAIIHCLECDLNFHTHLHNGDPLTARTVQVPKGHPVNGNPPFTFKESAVDALTIEGFTTWTDWTTPGMLYLFEKYNGFGYRSRGINSPYLWSYSQHYTKGKFVADGRFDPDAVSQQEGAAVILRRINERQLLLGLSDIITQIRTLGETVNYDPAHDIEAARTLQNLLNSTGLHLKVDGKAGQNTSDAYKHISGKFLNGDPRG
ncbi:MAG TPA: hypothetical protein VG738_04470 [Chitinophagaceae bacterium]|nr:hypothetical protein [Chitinophagaceae bacterium]